MKWSEVTEYDKEVIIDLWDKGWMPEDMEDEAGIPLEGIYRTLVERGRIKPEENPYEYDDQED